MKLKTTYSLFVLLISVFLISCDDSYSPPSDPKEAILGRWKLIEYGTGFNNMSEVPSTECLEFYSNDSIGNYNSSTNQYVISNMTYRIDSLLSFTFPLAEGRKTTLTYKYKFYDDKLDIEAHSFMAEIPCFRYKRIK